MRYARESGAGLEDVDYWRATIGLTFRFGG
jgi:hypothetical protein